MPREGGWEYLGKVLGALGKGGKKCLGMGYAVPEMGFGARGLQLWVPGRGVRGPGRGSKKTSWKS